MPRGNQALPNLLALRKNGVPARPLGIVLVALTLWLAQVAELSGQSPSPRQYGPNSVAGPNSLVPDYMVAEPEPVAAADSPTWEFFFRGGPTIPIKGGFLEDRLQTGWTIQFGAAEALWSGPRLVLGHEVAGTYTENRGKDEFVVMSGFFQGRDPPDNHVHGFADFAESRIVELRRGGFHYALGGSIHPTVFNDSSRGFRVQFRGGLRSGFMDVDYEKGVPPVVAEGIREHFGHGHKSIFLSTLAGEDPNLYFGLFVSLGVGYTIGNITFTADLEYGHDWFDLGDFAHGDHGVSSLTPLVGLAISF